MKAQIKKRITAVAIGLIANAILVAPALARPAASFYTHQQLEAMSSNWAAKGRLLGDRPAASFYTREQLEAMSSNWAAKGRLLGDRPAASFYTPQQLEAMSSNWAAKGRLLVGRSTPEPTAASARFDWGDFGIGAVAMLGLVLVVSGFGAAAYHGRKGNVRPRPVS